ncbi:MAG: M4 family metallopeptidase [Legionellales bacterium]|nr:M4 family metallopeptidase [Legionellales bacterium]
MHQYSYLSLVSLSSLMMMSPVYAATPIPLQHAAPPALKQTFQLLLPHMKTAFSPSTNTLNFVEEHLDKRRITHTRFKQYYLGFPVWGGDLIMHGSDRVHSFDGDPKIRMNGVVFDGLERDLGRAPVSFVSGAGAALEQFKANYPQALVSEEHVMPMIYLDQHHQAFWAYQVSVLVSPLDDIPKRPTALIDAQTGKQFLQWNDLKTVQKYVQAKGFGGNPVTGKYQYGLDLPFLKIMRDPRYDLCTLANNEVKVVNMEHRYAGVALAMSFDCPDNDSLDENTYWTGSQRDGYDLDNEAYSPSNDALYTGQVIKNLYKEWVDQDVLVQDKKPMKLVMRVHFGKGYENAFWDGRQMTFGDGDTLLYPLVSIGVGAHEVSHGFTEQHSDLMYFGQSGGINESFSDMAAQAAEYYAFGKNAWAIGTEILKKDSGMLALRFMDDPRRDGQSIDKAIDFRPDMDVHYSSGVYNRLFYLLANQPSWDIKKAFQVMVKANMDYWLPLSTFDEAGCGILSAANDLGYSLDGVKQVLGQVTVNYSECGDEGPTSVDGK